MQDKQVVVPHVKDSMTMTSLSCIVNITGADGLVMQGATASAAGVLEYSGFIKPWLLASPDHQHP